MEFDKARARRFILESAIDFRVCGPLTFTSFETAAT